MKSEVLSGLDVLCANKSLQTKLLKGKVAYLCHGPSVNAKLRSGIDCLKDILGQRLVALFTPQHGLFGDVQANMVESQSFVHPYYKVPVWSLYSTSRAPTPEMLKGIDTLVIDLQDVGTRVYTYIHTTTLAMEACAKAGVNVVVLDRPNPIGGVAIEGNILEPAFASFVGRHPLPMRHALTIGEVAKLAAKYFGSSCDLSIVEMRGWKRSMYFHETTLPWVMPSPNIPTYTTCFPYVGSVMFEGIFVSEGRGSTIPFELIGHPKLDPYAFANHLRKVCSKAGLQGFELRPLFFKPTFDKFAGESCGGLQVHITNEKKYRPWQFFCIAARELRNVLQGDFNWRLPPYEYEHKLMPVDIIHGTDKIRKWVDTNGKLSQLQEIEELQLKIYLKQRSQILLYK